MSKGNILIIDDDTSQLELLRIFLSRKGYTVHCVPTATEGLEAGSRLKPDLVILDIRLPDMDGIEVLQHLKKKNKAVNIIMITAYHDMETTVKAMRFGAYDYITKPIDVEELQRAVVRAFAFAKASGIDEQSQSESRLQKGSLIGASKSMQEIFKAIGVLCQNNVTVLIEGETGTGKELIARAIHSYGPRENHPFTAIDCSTIVGTLLESELFGHEKGAFTGATSVKKGRLELAGEGTVFLDEIGEIPIELQAKLMRFLQEKEFQRIGAEKNLKSKARVIAATNRNLWEMVNRHSFREDLYYRLSVAKIYVPPLRERREDIPLLIKHLLNKVSSELGKSTLKIEESTVIRMMEHDWPGNVRELENILLRAAVMTRGDLIPEYIITPFLTKGVDQRLAAMRHGSLQELEREHISRVLGHTGWHVTKTAQILGISRPTLRAKIKQYKIERKNT